MRGLSCPYLNAFWFSVLTTKLDYNSISKQCDKTEEKLPETTVSWSKIVQKQT